MAIQLKLDAKLKDLGGGLVVRRLLPAAGRQAVGPFLFMDHFGPLSVAPGASADVRPHPHVGLATVTYLFEGALMHRDSLGTVQRIEPGDLNWMTAGRGIVHSERRPEDLRDVRHTNHGLQLWAALPREHEGCAPAFCHMPADALPSGNLGQVQVKVLLGEAFGMASPVATLMPTIYVDLQMPAGSSLIVPPLAKELAVYAVDHGVRLDGETLAPHCLALLTPGADVELAAEVDTRLMLLGGDPLDGPRFMWWNFVSSRKETIAMAAQDWSGHVFGYVVDETEMAALPDRRAPRERRKGQRATDRRTKLPKPAQTRAPASEK